MRMLERLRKARLLRGFGLLLIGLCAWLPIKAQADCLAGLSALRFDETCFLYTHNSFNVKGQHRLPNQNLSVAEQLQLGVRGMMLDVYDRKGALIVCHASPKLGHRPLAEDLGTIKRFLDENPREIFSIIFENHVPAQRIAAAIQAAGLEPFAHAQPLNAAWPTLAAMQTSNRRLVVFVEQLTKNDHSAQPTVPDWIHWAWDYMTENHYANHRPDDFSFVYNRGQARNSLYLMNHFITSRHLGVGKRKAAKVVNQAEFILQRCTALEAQLQRHANFIAVDFVDLGQAKQAVDALNCAFLSQGK